MFMQLSWGLCRNITANVAGHLYEPIFLKFKLINMLHTHVYFVEAYVKVTFLYDYRYCGLYEALHLFL